MINEGCNKLEPFPFFSRGLEELQVNRRTSLFFVHVNLTEIVMCLEDLINYFAQPEEDMGKFEYSKILLLLSCA